MSVSAHSNILSTSASDVLADEDLQYIETQTHHQCLWELICRARPESRKEGPYTTTVFLTEEIDNGLLNRGRQSDPRIPDHSHDSIDHCFCIDHWQHITIQAQEFEKN